MTARSLLASSSPTTTRSPNTELAVIIIAIVCALFCLIALVIVRCTCRLSFFASSHKKCLKKKVINSLPKFTLDSENQHSANLSGECAICLVEFKVGEEVRVLPQCGHGFHLGCIDTWLCSNSSCPTCRHDLVSDDVSSATIRPEPREGHVNTFNSK